MELQFKIANDYISEVGLKIAPVADSVNHLYAAFEFDEAWDGTVKTAIFGGGGKTYHVILKNDNRCIIPWEVLTGACFTVSAFGIVGTERITATELKIPLAPSGYKNGQPPSEPSDSAYTQLLQMLSWVITNKAALTKFAEGSTDVPDMINVATEDGSITLMQALDNKADKVTDDGFVAGKNAKITGTGGVAIGFDATARSGAALGDTASTDLGGAVGGNAQSTTGGAVGVSTRAGAGFAGGANAQCVNGLGDVIDAIQLGTGTNSEYKTLQIYNYPLMDANGNIPAERLNNYYTKTEADGLLDDKADVTSITTPSGATPNVTLTDNTESRCGAVTALTLTLPSDTTGDYISSVVFTSGTTAASLTYPDDIAMIGTDCIDGVFAPVAGKRYTLIVSYDGAGLVGAVGGYAV